MSPNNWRPTANQNRLIRWAIWTLRHQERGHIDLDDLQQTALMAVWQNDKISRKEDGYKRGDGIAARSAIINMLQQAFGRAGDARRRTADATERIEWSSKTTNDDVDGEIPEWTRSLVEWDTPETLLALKQSLFGIDRMSSLQKTILYELVYGDLELHEVSAKFNCSFSTVKQLRNDFAKIIALG